MRGHCTRPFFLPKNDLGLRLSNRVLRSTLLLFLVTGQASADGMSASTNDISG